MYRICYFRAVLKQQISPHFGLNSQVVSSNSRWCNHVQTQTLTTNPVPDVKTGDNGEPETTGTRIGGKSSLRTPKSGKTNKSATTPRKPDPLTIFHSPSSRLVSLQLTDREPNVSLFFKKNQALVNVTLKSEADRKDIEVEENKEASITSVEDLSWKRAGYEPGTLPGIYMKLAKIRLTGLVVLTTMVGYGIAPGAFDPLVFACCTIGTGMTSASANSINQYLEIPYDSQMNRTKNRPLVRGQISAVHGMSFAAVTASTGILMLSCGVNSLTAGLGAFNLCLYTMGYTPMKRISISNTWIGSIVGAIPPMMGWTAATGSLDGSALLLGALLFAWQFPHFNALSWNLRPDYSRAGYRMMSVVNPDLCKRTALTYSLLMIPLCTLAPILDITTWSFAADSLPLNLFLSYLAWRFYRQGDSNSSRKLFRFSLVHIPVLLAFMMISKKHYGKQETPPKPTMQSLTEFYDKAQRRLGVS